MVNCLHSVGSWSINRLMFHCLLSVSRCYLTTLCYKKIITVALLLYPCLGLALSACKQWRPLSCLQSVRNPRSSEVCYFFLSISLFYHLPVAENAQISVCDCPIFIDIRSTSEKTQQEASAAFRRVTGSFPPLRNPIQYPSGS